MIHIYKDGLTWEVWTDPEDGEKNGRCLAYAVGADVTLDTVKQEAISELLKDFNQIILCTPSEVIKDRG